MRSLATKKNNQEFIVSLTSYGVRINSTLPYTLISLFSQSVRPDRIVLWLAEKPSPRIEKFKRYGLEINYCEDIRSYKKLIPTIEKYPNAVIVTADDDIFYTINWFKKLKVSYLESPNKIHFHLASSIKTKDSKLLPYIKWSVATNNSPKQSMFPIGCGGILYPPGSLYHLITNKQMFLELSPLADDIWFWAMAILNNTEYELVKNGIRNPFNIRTDTPNLFSINALENQNDVQLRNIINRFKQIDIYIKDKLK